MNAIKYVKERLLEQNQRATGPMGGCQYRTKEGLKCAVGHLLDLPENSPVFNFKGGAYTLMKEIDPPLKFPCSLKLLVQMQTIHDTMPPETWNYEFTKLELDN